MGNKVNADVKTKNKQGKICWKKNKLVNFVHLWAIVKLERLLMGKS